MVAVARAERESISFNSQKSGFVRKDSRSTTDKLPL